MNSKKGAINIQALVVTLVIIGLFIGIGLLFLQEVSENIGSDSGNVINETVATITTAGDHVAKANVSCFYNFVPTIITNETSGDVIASSNYTYNSHTGQIFAVSTADPYYNQGWNITYTYSWANGSEVCSGISDTSNATLEIPSWLSIVAIIAIAAIILLIVFNVVKRMPSASSEGSWFNLGGGSSSGTVAQI